MSTLISLPGMLAVLALSQASPSEAVAQSLAAALLAADEPSNDIIDDDDARAGDLHFRFTPGAWLPRLGGESRFESLPGADDISLENDFELDDREASPNFEMAITKGQRWQVDFSGFDFSTDGRGVLDFAGAFGDIAFSPGDAYRASFDMTSVALSVSYWQWPLIDSDERGGSVGLRLAWGAGFRWLSVEQGLELPGTGVATSGDGEWLIPELIFQLDFEYQMRESFPVLDAYQVYALVSAGPAIGGDGGMVVTLRAGMRFWITPCFSVDFGYRLLEAGVENQDYELAGGLQGLFLSGSLRF